MSVIERLEHISNHSDVLLRFGLLRESQETFEPSPLVFDTVSSLCLSDHFIVLFLLQVAGIFHLIKVYCKRFLRFVMAAHSTRVLISYSAFHILSDM